MTEVRIDVSALYEEAGQAKLDKLSEYEAAVLEQAGEGRIVTLTGPAPVWMYLRLAHALHGKALKLEYDSPASGRVSIFNHDPR